MFTPKIGEDSHFDSYFSDGLKPPTRERLTWNLRVFTPGKGKKHLPNHYFRFYVNLRGCTYYSHLLTCMYYEILLSIIIHWPCRKLSKCRQLYHTLSVWVIWFGLTFIVTYFSWPISRIIWKFTQIFILCPNSPFTPPKQQASSRMWNQRNDLCFFLTPHPTQNFSAPLDPNNPWKNECFFRPPKMGEITCV